MGTYVIKANAAKPLNREGIFANRTSIVRAKNNIAAMSIFLGAWTIRDNSNLTAIRIDHEI